MKISVRSKNGADLSTFDRKVIKMATVFYANQLMSSKLCKSLEIKINIHQISTTRFILFNVFF